MNKFKCEVPCKEVAELLCRLGGKKFNKSTCIDSTYFGKTCFLFELDGDNYGMAYDTSRVAIDNKWKTVSLEEMFLILSNGDFKPIEVKLNAEHIAIVEKDLVKVGCQTFTFEAVDAARPLKR